MLTPFSFRLKKNNGVFNCGQYLKIDINYNLTGNKCGVCSHDEMQK